MAPNYKKSPLQRPKTHWFLGWFGIPFRATSNKKASNSGNRPKRRLFKLCMPKIKVIIVRKKKASFDTKMVSFKANQSKMVDATNKVKHVKVKHVETIQELNMQPKVCNDQDDYKSQTDQSKTTKCREQKPSPTTEKSIDNKVVKDSFVGVSIMVITLIIMSIWGRLCAILCMSVWLYCVSLLRACRDASPNLDDIKKDVASKLYKRKRVTLEGLFQLDRDNRIGAS